MFINRVKIVSFFVLIFLGSSCQLTAKMPIVYRDEYNVSLGTFLDKVGGFFHPFDGRKYGKVHRYLVDKCGIAEDQFYTPEKISDAELLRVHTPAYLKSLESSWVISEAVDMEFGLAPLSNKFLQSHVLDPMRYAVGGTVLAAQLALEHGWAINLAGGYHHAKAEKGEGGCIFADVPLAVLKLRDTRPGLKVLIVDLDAHQGNGFEDCFKDDNKTFVIDMYNKNEYPKNEDDTAQYIDFPVALDGGHLASRFFGFDVSELDILTLLEKPYDRRVDEQEYLNKLNMVLAYAGEKLQAQDNMPDLVVFNAGTDPVAGDDWGCMNVSQEGMIERDRIVWHWAQKHDTPIMMVLSGGYGPKSAEIISKSIEAVLTDRGVIN